MHTRVSTRLFCARLTRVRLFCTASSSCEKANPRACRAVKLGSSHVMRPSQLLLLYCLLISNIRKPPILRMVKLRSQYNRMAKHYSWSTQSFEYSHTSIKMPRGLPHLARLSAQCSLSHPTVSSYNLHWSKHGWLFPFSSTPALQIFREAKVVSLLLLPNTWNFNRATSPLCSTCSAPSGARHFIMDCPDHAMEKSAFFWRSSKESRSRCLFGGHHMPKRTQDSSVRYLTSRPPVSEGHKPLLHLVMCD